MVYVIQNIKTSIAERFEARGQEYQKLAVKFDQTYTLPRKVTEEVASDPFAVDLQAVAFQDSLLAKIRADQKKRHVIATRTQVGMVRAHTDSCIPPYAIPLYDAATESNTLYCGFDKTSSVAIQTPNPFDPSAEMLKYFSGERKTITVDCAQLTTQKEIDELIQFANENKIEQFILENTQNFPAEFLPQLSKLRTVAFIRIEDELEKNDRQALIGYKPDQNTSAIEFKKIAARNRVMQYLGIQSTADNPWEDYFIACFTQLKLKASCFSRQSIDIFSDPFLPPAKRYFQDNCLLETGSDAIRELFAFVDKYKAAFIEKEKDRFFRDFIVGNERFSDPDSLLALEKHLEEEKYLPGKALVIRGIDFSNAEVFRSLSAIYAMLQSYPAIQEIRLEIKNELSEKQYQALTELAKNKNLTCHIIVAVQKPAFGVTPARPIARLADLKNELHNVVNQSRRTKYSPIPISDPSIAMPDAAAEAAPTISDIPPEWNKERATKMIEDVQQLLGIDVTREQEIDIQQEVQQEVQLAQQTEVEKMAAFTGDATEFLDETRYLKKFYEGKEGRREIDQARVQYDKIPNYPPENRPVVQSARRAQRQAPLAQPPVAPIDYQKPFQDFWKKLTGNTHQLENSVRYISNEAMSEIHRFPQHFVGGLCFDHLPDGFYAEWFEDAADSKKNGYVLCYNPSRFVETAKKIPLTPVLTEKPVTQTVYLGDSRQFGAAQATKLDSKHFLTYVTPDLKNTVEKSAIWDAASDHKKAVLFDILYHFGEKAVHLFQEKLNALYRQSPELAENIVNNMVPVLAHQFMLPDNLFILDELSKLNPAQTALWNKLLIAQKNAMGYVDLVVLYKGFSYFLAHWPQDLALPVDAFFMDASPLAQMDRLLFILHSVHASHLKDQIQYFNALDLTSEGAYYAARFDGFHYFHPAMQLQGKALENENPPREFKVDFRKLVAIALDSQKKPEEVVVAFHRFLGRSNTLHMPYAQYVELATAAVKKNPGILPLLALVTTAGELPDKKTLDALLSVCDKKSNQSLEFLLRLLKQQDKPHITAEESIRFINFVKDQLKKNASIDDSSLSVAARAHIPPFLFLQPQLLHSLSSVASEVIRFNEELRKLFLISEPPKKEEVTPLEISAQIAAFQTFKVRVDQFKTWLEEFITTVAGGIQDNPAQLASIGGKLKIIRDKIDEIKKIEHLPKELNKPLDKFKENFKYFAVLSKIRTIVQNSEEGIKQWKNLLGLHDALLIEVEKIHADLIEKKKSAPNTPVFSPAAKQLTANSVDHLILQIKAIHSSLSQKESKDIARKTLFANKANQFLKQLFLSSLGDLLTKHPELAELNHFCKDVDFTNDQSVNAYQDARKNIFELAMRLVALGEQWKTTRLPEMVSNSSAAKKFSSVGCKTILDELSIQHQKMPLRLLKAIFSTNEIHSKADLTGLISVIIAPRDNTLSINQQSQLISAIYAADISNTEPYEALITQLSKITDPIVFEFGLHAIEKNQIENFEDKCQFLQAITDSSVRSFIARSEKFSVIFLAAKGINDPHKKNAFLKIIAYGLLAHDSHHKNIDTLIETLKSRDDLVALASPYEKIPKPRAEQLEKILNGTLKQEEFSLDPSGDRKDPATLKKHFSIDTIHERIDGIIDLNRVLADGGDKALFYRDRVTLDDAVAYVTAVGHDYPLTTLDALKKPVDQLTDAEIKAAISDYKKILRREINKDPRELWIAKCEFVAILREVMYRTHFHEEENGHLSGTMPYDTQIMSVLNVLLQGGNVFSEIGTGEGKSITTAMLAMCQWAEVGTVDLCSANMELAARDREEFSDFYAYMGVNTALISSDSKYDHYCKDGINFSDISELTLWQEQQLLDGKELPDQVSLVVDEVDFTALDNITQFRYAKGIEGADPYDNPHEKLYPHILHFTQNQALFKGLKCSRAADIENLRKYIGSLSPTQLNATLKEKFKILSPQLLDRWIDAACVAQKLREGEDYAVRTIMKTRYGQEIEASEAQVKVNFRVQPKSRFSDGVHQFLHVLLNERMEKDHAFREKCGGHPFLIEQEKTYLASRNSKNTLDYYLRGEKPRGRVIGVTGTMGNAADRKELSEHYDARFYRIPPHQPRLRESREPWLAKSGLLGTPQNAHFKAILEDVQKAQKNNQAILIVCKSVQASTELHAYLAKHLSRDKLQLHNGEQKNQREKEVVDRAGNLSMVTISTPMFGRGTDIKPKHAVKGGLHVITTYLSGDREYGQNIGRAGRNGAKGSDQLIISTDEFTSRDRKIPSNKTDLRTAIQAIRKELDDAKTADRYQRQLFSDIKDQFFTLYVAHCKTLSDDDKKSAFKDWESFLKTIDQTWHDLLAGNAKPTHAELNQKSQTLCDMAKAEWKKYFPTINADRVVSKLTDDTLLRSPARRVIVADMVAKPLSLKAEKPLRSYLSLTRKELTLGEANKLLTAAVRKIRDEFHLDPAIAKNATVTADHIRTVSHLLLNRFYDTSGNFIVVENGLRPLMDAVIRYGSKPEQTMFLTTLKNHIESVERDTEKYMKSSVLLRRGVAKAKNWLDIGKQDATVYERSRHLFQCRALQADFEKRIKPVMEQSVAQSASAARPSAEPIVTEKSKWEKARNFALKHLQDSYLGWSNASFFSPRATDRKNLAGQIKKDIEKINGSMDDEKIVALLGILNGAEQSIIKTDKEKDDSRTSRDYRNKEGSRLQKVIQEMRAFALAQHSMNQSFAYDALTSATQMINARATALSIALSPYPAKITKHNIFMVYDRLHDDYRRVAQQTGKDPQGKRAALLHLLKSVIQQCDVLATVFGINWDDTDRKLQSMRKIVQDELRLLLSSDVKKIDQKVLNTYGPLVSAVAADQQEPLQKIAHEIQTTMQECFSSNFKLTNIQPSGEGAEFIGKAGEKEITIKLSSLDKNVICEVVETPTQPAPVRELGA